MDGHEKTADEFGLLLAAELAVLSQKERNRKRADGYKIPTEVYETIEDLGVIESAMACMGRIWNRDSEDFRKASLHLSKLRFDLRKKLHDFL